MPGGGEGAGGSEGAGGERRVGWGVVRARFWGGDELRRSVEVGGGGKVRGCWGGFLGAWGGHFGVASAVRGGSCRWSAGVYIANAGICSADSYLECALVVDVDVDVVVLKCVAKQLCVLFGVSSINDA